MINFILMRVITEEQSSLQGKIDIEDFSNHYVSEAFELLIENHGEMYLDDFDRELRKRVGNDEGISPEVVKHLHHVFHHEMFCNGKENLRLEQDTRRGGKMKVLLLRYSDEEFLKLKQDVLAHRDYLNERAASYGRGNES